MPLLIDEVVAEVQQSGTSEYQPSEPSPASGGYHAPLFEQLEKLRERQQRLEAD